MTASGERGRVSPVRCSVTAQSAVLGVRGPGDPLAGIVWLFLRRHRCHCCPLLLVRRGGAWDGRLWVREVGAGRHRAGATGERPAGRHCLGLCPPALPHAAFGSHRKPGRDSWEQWGWVGAQQVGDTGGLGTGSERLDTACWAVGTLPWTSQTPGVLCSVHPSTGLDLCANVAHAAQLGSPAGARW